MIGYTFAPDQQDEIKKRLNTGQLGAGPQSALQVLALRLPNVLGGAPISPDTLLRAPVGGTAPLPAVVSSVLTGNPAHGPITKLPVAGSPPVSASSSLAPSESASLADLVNNAIGTGPSSPFFRVSNPGDSPTPSVGSSVAPTAPATTNAGSGVDDLLNMLMRGGGSSFGRQV
jgi:hypothetical protein